MYNAIVRPYFDYCCEDDYCMGCVWRVNHNQNDYKNFKIELLELSWTWAMT
jgi:hypothetical protein